MSRNLLPYNIIPDEVVRSPAWAQTSSHAKALYITLTSFYNRETRSAFPSYSTIMTFMGIGQRKIISRALIELKRVGFIRIEKFKNPRGGAFNLYRLPYLEKVLNLYETRKTKKASKVEEAEEEEEDTVVIKITGLGIKKRRVKELVTKHGEEYLEKKLLFLDWQREMGITPKNPAGFFLSSVRGDWKDGPIG